MSIFRGDYYICPKFWKLWTAWDPTHIRLVPSGSGVKTAYPINESLEPLNILGIYFP